MLALLNRPPVAQAAKLALDLALWSIAAVLAFVFRLEERWLAFQPGLFVLIGVGVPTIAALLAAFGLPRRSWHRLALPDLTPLALVVLLGTLPGLALAFASPGGVIIPRSVPLIAAPLALLLMGGARVAVRRWFESLSRPRPEGGGRPDAPRRVLIAGAGDAGQLIAREMRCHPEGGLLPVGFLDDDARKRQQRLGGLPVLGGLADVARAAETCNADEVVVAMPSASGTAVRRVAQAAREAGVRHRILPALHDLISGRVAIGELRPINVEDLLRRQPVRLETDRIEALVRGRRVLVTGAGGSIGSEIVRQVSRFDPAEVILLGRGEHSVFAAEQEIRRQFPHVRLCSVITDVRDLASLHAAFERYTPEIVFHAAAHKHVPLMEANPSQAVLNNVVGSANVARLCLETGVRRLVNVSTDKAVNPTSVMGASKRVAEMMIRRASLACGPQQAFVSVRFGNVLGSRGSVVPIFKEQIARGGPVVVTHPEMQRYFMTIPEASQLVLQAGAMAENGHVYVLDMGDPVKIVDLARDLILLSGLVPDRDVAIKFSGMRPGEKLFEELLTAEEGTESSRHEKIFVARKNGVLEDNFDRQYRALLEAADSYDGNAVRAALMALVPSYVPEMEAAVVSGDGAAGRPVHSVPTAEA